MRKRCGDIKWLRMPLNRLFEAGFTMLKNGGKDISKAVSITPFSIEVELLIRG
jgi:hypothetical protein